MFIQSNIEAMQAYRNLSAIDSNFNKSLQKLSTGLSLPDPGYGGGMFAVANDMEHIYQNYITAAKNVQDAKGFLETANTVMMEANDILLRMSELASRSTTATTNTDQRLEMSREFSELKLNLQDLTSQARYNELSLFSTNGTDGRTLSVVFGENRMFKISTYSVSLSTLKVSTIGISTAASATAALSAVTSGVTILSGYLARMGGQIQQIDSKVTILNEQMVQEKAMESRINELDFAQEMKTFTSLQVTMQASNAMLAQANMKAQMVLQLFGG